MIPLHFLPFLANWPGVSLPLTLVTLTFTTLPGFSGATFTIKRQSDFGGTGTGGGTANDYGLKITNQAGTSTIIDDTSRIGAIIASESHTFSGPGTQSDTMFQGFDCSSKSETGLVVRWTGTAWLTPIPSRSTNGVTFTKIGTTLSGNGTLFVNLIRY